MDDSHLAHGYDGTTDVSRLSLSWAWAAGALVSTADDVATFYRRLLQGRLLRPALLQEMLKNAVPAAGGAAYGLGILRLRTPCGEAWGHDGDLPGYSSLALSSRNGLKQLVIGCTTAQELSPAGRQAFSRLVEHAFCA